MPNFKKSTGYKMKGFTYPGESPLKVSDSDLVEMQQKLNKAELDFREPGWAKIAREVYDTTRKVATGGMIKGEKGKAKSKEDASPESNGGGGKSAPGTVQQRASQNELEETPPNPLDDPNQGPVWA